MRWFAVLLGIAFAVATTCAGASARSDRAAETITVSNTESTAVKSATVLEPTHSYRITVSGTVSDWCTTSSCPAGNADTTAQPNVGVDGVYCYAKWRCPTPALWRQLAVDGVGLDQFGGLEGKIAYSGGHTYSVTVTGKSGPLTLGSTDALAGSTSDNSGSFKVTITDLGAAGTTTSGKPKSIKDARQYRAFLGLDDADTTDWNARLLSRCNDFANSIRDFPDVTSAVEIPGEERLGLHSSNLAYPGSDLFHLLSGDDPPATLYPANVYARVTPRFEAELRNLIKASGGNLEPGDVMRMALQVTHGSYPLAALTAHNLLKNVTKIGRGLIEQAGNPAYFARHETELLDKLAEQDKVVSKLVSLRADPDGPGAQDKMGPWYHIFAVTSASALVNPTVGAAVLIAEHATKLAKLFKNEGGFNREKATIDACFAGAITLPNVAKHARWFGSIFR